MAKKKKEYQEEKITKKAVEFYGSLPEIKIPTEVSIYIISYKRPLGNTMKSLIASGIENFTIILGNDDEFYPEYVKNYGAERVVVFDKPHYMKQTKYLGNNVTRSGAVPARNFIRELSISRGEEYHCVLDDDYITIEACAIRTHLDDFKGGWLLINALNAAKKFLERTGLPYVAGSIPNSPVGCKEDWTTPSIVKKGFNSFVFNNKKFVKWRFLTADDVTLTLTCWNLGIPVYGVKYLMRMGMVSEGGDKSNKGDTGNVAIYNSDLSFFKAFSATMAWPRCAMPGMRYIKTNDQVRFAHKVYVVGRVPHVIDAKYGIPGKKLDPDRYLKQYQTFRYKG